MVNRNFFMNTFFAVSLDTYNEKEQIIYSIGQANEFFNGKSMNVVTENREIGEFTFDFSESFEQFTSEDRANILYEYLSEYENFVKSNTLRWLYDDELIKKHVAFVEMLDFIKIPLLSEPFLDIQKHLSLNERHRYSSFEVLKSCYPDKMNGNNEDFRIFYIEDTPYIATDFNFIGLLRYYLDELYSAGLFPRKCMSCGKLFLSGKKHGDVLCSAECRKKKKSENTMAYYDNLSENEVLYTKIYRKWKQRIDRAETNHTISEKGIEQLRQELKELTNVNRIRANDRKKGNVPEKDGVPDYKSFDNKYHQILEDKDEGLYELFKSVKSD